MTELTRNEDEAELHCIRGDCWGCSVKGTYHLSRYTRHIVHISRIFC